MTGADERQHRQRGGAANELRAAQPPPGVGVRPADQRQPDGDAEQDQRDDDAAGDVEPQA